jgi:hypothetical protein
MPNDDYRGIQCYDKKEALPASLSDVQTLFAFHIDTITAAKKSFLDDLGAKALTLSPKLSFELRLHGLHVLYPDTTSSSEVEELTTSILCSTATNITNVD